MLKISTRGQYALLVMTDLAEIGTTNFTPSSCFLTAEIYP